MQKGKQGQQSFKEPKLIAVMLLTTLKKGWQLCDSPHENLYMTITAVTAVF